MAMLKNWATGTNDTTTFTKGKSPTQLLPNSAPTDAATTPYARWIANAGNYLSGAVQVNPGGGSNKASNATRLTGIYALGRMWKYRKILKRVGKFNQTNMTA